MLQETDRSGLEKSYLTIPELTSEDIESNCGFVAPNGSLVEASRKYFLDAIVSAIREPDWLLTPYYDEKTGMSTPPPASQNITAGQLDVLASLQYADTDDLYELAREINRGYRIPDMAAMAMGDIVAHAIEKLGNKYPHFSFFRGAEYDSERGSYDGFDFAPGYLPTAMSYVKHDINGKQRTNAILAAISFRDVGELFSMKKLYIGTEDDWWRGSLEIHIHDQDVRSQYVKLWRLPKDESQIKKIESKYKETATVVYHILGE